MARWWTMLASDWGRYFSTQGRAEVGEMVEGVDVIVVGVTYTDEMCLRRVVNKRDCTAKWRFL